jgi:hypothetical protein
MKNYKKNIFAFTGGKTKFADILDALRGLFGVDLLPYLKANNVNTSNIYDILRTYEENPQDLGIDFTTEDNIEFIATLNNANSLLKGNASFYDVIAYMQDFYNKNNALNNFIFNPFTGRYEVNPKPKIIDKNEPLKDVSQEVKKNLLPPEEINKRPIDKLEEKYVKTTEQVSKESKEKEVVKQAPKQNLLTKLFVSIFKIFK